MKSSGKQVKIRNANSPGWSGWVDAAKYEAVCAALLKVIPRKEPGVTAAEMRTKAVFHLPEHLFPAGEPADWWIKTVYLDLEADGDIQRDRTSKPHRWHRV